VLMENKYENFKDEISDLKAELDHFEQEKERVRAIVGKIGGVPQFRTRLINVLFIVIIIIAGVISIFSDEKLRLLMVELTTVMLSVKIIYMIHIQMRVNHFKFWILSAIEWRINEMMTQLKRMENQS
jgi:ABC-type multidrug transport system fused ATPase/permease subunit